MLELRANGEPSRFLRVTAGRLVAMAKGVSWRTLRQLRTDALRHNYGSVTNREATRTPSPLTAQNQETDL